jgi:hypothetical protein
MGLLGMSFISRAISVLLYHHVAQKTYNGATLIPPHLPLQKGGNYPSLAKRGEGRFSGILLFLIMDYLVNQV